MADTKTLDQRIREKAREELKKQIDAAAKPLLEMMAWGNPNVPTLLRQAANGPTTVDSHYALRAVCDQLFSTKVERAESDAITAFLQRVDSLQEQVNELRDLSHEH